MIETKLHQAMQAGPEPVTNYSQIEGLVHKNTRKSTVHSRRIRTTAVFAVCALLLLGAVAMAATTEVNYSAWASSSESFWDAERIADKLGLALPETLDDSPFCGITTMYVVPEGATYLDAITAPHYRWYDVDYGVEEIVHKDNSITTEVYDDYSIAFGSTDGNLWGYVFSLDESGTWVPDNLLPGSYRTEEYNGIILQIGTWVQYDPENEGEIFAYHHKVIWVDANNHAVFSLHKSFYAEENAADRLPSEMIEFAKSIIDLNKQE